jgi:amino acid adenylation domain-containing protein
MDGGAPAVVAGETLMGLLLQQLVSAQARRTPGAPAIAIGDRVVTYEELEASSNQLARALRDSGCSRGDRVCVLAPKNAAAMSAIIAIYKADCIYVPLEITSPAVRLAKIVTACEPRCILASAETASLLGDLMRLVADAETPIRIGALEDTPLEGEGVRSAFCLGDLSSVSTAPPVYRNWPDDAAHIFFRPAAMGSPRGVVITHANVVHFVRWANHYFNVGRTDRHSAHSPLTFDLSILDLIGTWAAGACVVPVAPELDAFPTRLVEFMRNTSLTQWCSVPWTMTYLAQCDALEPKDLPSLKRVLWSGDVMPSRTLRYWMDRLPHVRFTSLYGATETTIASSFFTAREVPPEGTVPIGEACPGEELLVLDASLNKTPPGEVGEVCVRGLGLSPGYWREPDATAAMFPTHPRPGDPHDRIFRTRDLGFQADNGLFHLSGHADLHVKTRGHDVELGEIEAALSSLPCLAASAVIAVKPDVFEDTSICCAYTPAPGADITPAGLRALLAELLPPYMFPSHWKAFPKLPATPTGALDREQLARAFAPSIIITG